MYSIFARVSWPNIGPAATEPAGPAPTALFRGNEGSLVCMLHMWVATATNFGAMKDPLVCKLHM